MSTNHHDHENFYLKLYTQIYTYNIQINNTWHSIYTYNNMWMNYRQYYKIRVHKNNFKCINMEIINEKKNHTIVIEVEKYKRNNNIRKKKK